MYIEEVITPRLSKILLYEKYTKSDEIFSIRLQNQLHLCQNNILFIFHQSNGYVHLQKHLSK